jgi:glycosidase
MFNTISGFLMIKKLYFLTLMLVACGTDLPQPVTPPVEGEEPVQYGVPYANVPATQDVVLYEVNTRAFSAEGNFQGVINRLDEIKALGVNTIWLMPIHPVGQLNSAGGLGSPYAVQDYLKVNTEFGDLAKLRELVEKAHSRNMAVIIDWVANHTAWDNPWISKKLWYTTDASGNIIIPPGTNWKDVAELNYSNSDMRAAMIHAMKYWVLEANIDGFRCDAVDFVPTDFWKQAIDELKNIKNRNLIFLAEGGKADNFTAGFQMNYAWDFYNNLREVYGSGKSAVTIFNTHQAEYNAIPAGARKLRYTTNHDQSAYDGTPVELFGGLKGAVSAAVITAFTSSVPLIYSSQEVGQSEKLPFFTREPINWTANADVLEQYKKIFSIYSSTQAFKRGALQYYSDKDIAVFTRTFESDTYLILVNTRNSMLTYSIEATLQNSTWTNAVSGASVSLSTTVSLQPYQYMILRK